jgi:hypothetical protein
MIDHTGFAVADLETSKRFYTAALQGLGITLLAEVTPQQSGGRARGVRKRPKTVLLDWR